MNTKKESRTGRIIFCVIIALCMVGAMLLLNKQVQGSLVTKSLLPTLDATPIYEDIDKNDGLQVSYTAESSMRISAIDVLLIGTDEAAEEDELTVTVSADEDTYTTEPVKVADIMPGEWYSISLDAMLNEGTTYDITVVSDCDKLRFMSVSGYEPGISIGYEVVVSDHVSLGDIFYYSRALVMLAGVTLILLVLFGKKRLLQAIEKVKITDWIAGFGNEVFLIILFVTLCLKIYVTAYVDGVYITADSDGYLREAMNLVSGNGFAYDGLAGYDSWFANWPIVYPAMIAFIMLVSGLNAYLSSKIVAFICIGLIFICLYIRYRKKSWIYALAFTNIGFLQMAYNTWSEIPFVLFLMIFAFALADICERKDAKISKYILLGISALLVFLTRYFGIFVWFVMGGYIVLMCGQLIGEARKDGVKIKEYITKNGYTSIKRPLRLTVTAGCSGIVALGYLVMNKIKNGNPTGVSRGTWWDDYQTLTNDLVHSLVTEIFNVFSLQLPEFVERMPEYLQLWCVLAVIIAIIIYVVKHCKRNSSASVLFVLATAYYLIFICVRYRSSMDTFYYRFFAPATVLLVLGIIDTALNGRWEQKIADKSMVRYVAAAITALLIASSITSMARVSENNNHPYYDVITANWDGIYEKLPKKSVLIWGDLDYRSTWYRPDVINGELFMDDTVDAIKDRYAPSEHVLMRRSDAQIVVSEAEYDSSLRDLIQNAIDCSQETDKYVILY